MRPHILQQVGQRQEQVEHVCLAPSFHNLVDLVPRLRILVHRSGNRVLTPVPDVCDGSSMLRFTLDLAVEQQRQHRRVALAVAAVVPVLRSRRHGRRQKKVVSPVLHVVAVHTAIHLNRLEADLFSRRGSVHLAS